jgi:tetratricopeptide (TPR) repeat protein
MRRLLRFIAVTVLAVLLCGEAALGGLPPAPNVIDGVRASAIAGDVGMAIDRLEPYVAEHPKDANAARMLGDLYFRNAESDRAEAVWRAETLRNPDDRETHVRLGNFYAADNRRAEAIAEFQQSIPLRSGLVALIELQRRTRGLDAFVARAAADARRRYDDSLALTVYAIVLEATDRAGDALEYFTSAVKLAPELDRCEALVSRAIDLLDLKRGSDAAADLQACLRENHNDYSALTMLAWTYLHPGAYERARPLLERALAVQPYGVEALIDMGYLDDATGDGEAAALCYRKALAGDPLRPESYINLGYDFAASRRYPQAEAMFSAGLRAAPESGRLHYLLGVTYRIEGKLALAQAQFQAALSSEETDVVNAARAALATLPNMVG